VKEQAHQHATNEGYWIQKDSASKATRGLGFRLEGGKASGCFSPVKKCGSNTAEHRSHSCGYRRSPFILIEKYAAVVLEVCRGVFAESDVRQGRTVSQLHSFPVAGSVTPAIPPGTGFFRQHRR